VAAGILALALLTPFLHGFVFLLEAGNSSCGMSCCKTARACCRRSGQSDNHRGPKWTSGPKCARDCGRSAALPGSPGWSLTSGEIHTGPSLRESSFLRSFGSAWSRPGVEFALFERPPPLLG
jgi:hypothetical protein